MTSGIEDNTGSVQMHEIFVQQKQETLNDDDSYTSEIDVATQNIQSPVNIEPNLLHSSSPHSNAIDQKSDQHFELDNKTIRDAVRLWYRFSQSSIEKYGHISKWNTSKVTNMSELFQGMKNFNEDISKWNVSNVTNMSWMFSEASSFNQPLGDWDVSNVTDMSAMLRGASSFNQPLGEWDVSKVTNMSWMFNVAFAFNQPLGEWDVSTVTNMSGMFAAAERFNQPLGEWDVSNVKGMVGMFSGASSFNQPLGEWDVSNVTSMIEMFRGASSFNQPLGEWNVSNVTDMRGMFRGASSFNQPLGEWDVSKVTDMSEMFYFCNNFNQPLSNWNVSKVTSLESMFQAASSFDQMLSSWNIPADAKMRRFLCGATAFSHSVEFIKDRKNVFERDSELDIDRTLGVPSFTPAKEYFKVAASNNSSSSEAQAINDSSRFGVDRLGYSAYAKAMYTVLKSVSAPLCVGLYARWGSGKSFMVQLLKQHFDPDVTVVAVTKELVQWFEDDWEEKQANAEASNNSTTWLYCICTGLQSVLEWIWVFLSQQYFMSVLAVLFIEMIVSCCKSKARSNSKQKKDVETGFDAQKEYVFVDFNAWEFSNSDELWAGLIRNIYNKVEKRLESHQRINAAPMNRKDLGTEDWKRKWRVQKSKEILIESYGGMAALQLRLFVLMLFVSGIIVIAIFSAYGQIHVWTQLVTGVSNSLSVAAGAIASVLTAVPCVRLLYNTYHSVNTSVGDSIFQEANRVQDNIGFLSRVRGELDELFAFMRQYKDATGIELILVVFVDDLDRCLGGRNVKVLEAIQLVLAIPGAPVLVVMAIDSRVVIASIEATINKSLSLHDALISGYEYMDKIVQFPFCLPDCAKDKVENYLENCISKVPDVNSVALLVRCIAKGIAKFQQEVINAGLFSFVRSSEYIVLKVKDSRGIEGGEFLQLVPDEYVKDGSVPMSYGEAKSIVLKVGKLLCHETKLLVTLYNDVNQASNKLSLSGADVMEMLCKKLTAILKTVSIQVTQKHPGTKMQPKKQTTPTPNPQRLNKAEVFKVPTVGKELEVEKTLALKTAYCMDICRNIINNAVRQTTRLPLLPLEMSSALLDVCKISESNPRRMKRILNVTLFAMEVARCKPESEDNPSQTISMNRKWPLMSAKVARWIFLCELYPYRMSFIVQILTDFEQRRLFNDSTLRSGYPKYMKMRRDIEYDNDPNDVEDAAFVKLDGMNIGTFFLRHVERYIYSIESAGKLLRLDGDPELFVSLLFHTIQCETIKDSILLCCRDILGPQVERKEEEEEEEEPDRNTAFSLMTYSFNLNPSMLKQIALELQQLSSEYELVDRVDIIEEECGTNKKTTQSSATSSDSIVQRSIPDEVEDVGKQLLHRNPSMEGQPANTVVSGCDKNKRPLKPLLLKRGRLYKKLDLINYPSESNVGKKEK